MHDDRKIVIIIPITVSRLSLNELLLIKRKIWMNKIWINISMKAEERSVIQNSFRSQGPNIRQAQSTDDPRSTVFSKSANLLDLRTNPQSVHF